MVTGLPPACTKFVTGEKSPNKIGKICLSYDLDAGNKLPTMFPQDRNIKLAVNSETAFRIPGRNMIFQFLFGLFFWECKFTWL